MTDQEKYNKALITIFRYGVEFGWGDRGDNANQVYMEALAEIKATVYSESETEEMRDHE